MLFKDARVFKVQSIMAALQVLSVPNMVLNLAGNWQHLKCPSTPVSHVHQS